MGCLGQIPQGGSKHATEASRVVFESLALHGTQIGVSPWGLWIPALAWCKKRIRDPVR